MIPAAVGAVVRPQVLTRLRLSNPNYETGLGQGRIAVLAEAHPDPDPVSRNYGTDIQVLIVVAPTARLPVTHMLCPATVNAATIARGNQPPYAVVNTLRNMLALVGTRGAGQTHRRGLSRLAMSPGG